MNVWFWLMVPAMSAVPAFGQTLNNPSFEGSLTSWQTWKDQAGGGFEAALIGNTPPNGAHDGTRIAFVKDLFNEGDSAGYYQDATGATNGATYVASVWVRLDPGVSGTADFQLGVDKEADQTTWGAGVEEQSAIVNPTNTAWSRITLTYTSDGGSDRVFLRVERPIGQLSTFGFWFDDVEVKDPDPLTCSITKLSADPNFGSVVSYQIAFNEQVNDFDVGDITVGGTAAGGTTLTNFNTNTDGDVYTVDVSNITTTGTIELSLAGGVAHALVDLSVANTACGPETYTIMAAISPWFPTGYTGWTASYSGGLYTGAEFHCDDGCGVEFTNQADTGTPEGDDIVLKVNTGATGKYKLRANDPTPGTIAGAHSGYLAFKSWNDWSIGTGSGNYNLLEIRASDGANGNTLNVNMIAGGGANSTYTLELINDEVGDAVVDTHVLATTGNGIYHTLWWAYAPGAGTFKMWDLTNWDGTPGNLPTPFFDATGLAVAGKTANRLTYGDESSSSNRNMNAWLDFIAFRNGGADSPLIALPPACTAPAIIGAESNLLHTGGNDYVTDLGIAPAFGQTENRLGGPKQIDILFDKDITPADGTLDGNEVSVSTMPASAGLTVNTVQIVNDDSIRIDLTGVDDRTCLKIDLSGIACDAGGSTPGPVMADVTLQQRVVFGDVGNSGKVSSADVNQANGEVGQPVGESNFRADVNADNVIDSADVNLIKAATSGIPVGCP